MRIQGGEAQGKQSTPDLSLHKLSLISSALSGLNLLSSREKKTAWFLVAGMVIGSFLEMGSVAAVLPFVSVVIQPESVKTNELLRQLYQWTGALSLPQFIASMGGGVMALIVVSAAINWGIARAQHQYAAKCQHRLATHLFDRYVHAPYAWYFTRNSTLLSKLIYDDVALWSRGVIYRALIMVNATLMVVMAMTLVLTFSFGGGILVIVGVALLGYSVLCLTRPPQSRLSTAKQAALKKLMLTSEQVLSGIKDIKLSSREGYFCELLSSTHASVASAHASLNVWQESPARIMFALAQVALVALSIYFWNTGVSQAELATQLALLIIVATKVIPSVGSLSSSVHSLCNALPHVREIRDALSSIEAEMRQGLTKQGRGKVLEAWHSIRMEQVGYRYPTSSAWALEDLNVELERNRSYGIVGPSAAGKSTLVDLLVGLLEPTSGRIFVDRDSLLDVEMKSWQKRIAYVPQTPFITDDSLRANVAFGVRRSDVDDKWVMECLCLANLESLPGELNQGLDTKLGERGMRLSGGQRQRIAIARALFNRPEILVLDEATSALDTLTEIEILDALKNLRDRITMITIAHRLSTVSLCNEIFVLQGGRLVGQGSYGDLQSRHDLFQRLVSANG